MVKESKVDIGGMVASGLSLAWDWLKSEWKDLTGQTQAAEQFDRTMDFQQQQVDTQLDLAKNGMQYKAADLEAAGFSKWAALEGSGSGVSASTVSAPSPAQGSVNAGAILSFISALVGQASKSRELDIQQQMANKQSSLYDAQIEHILAQVNETNAKANALSEGSFLDRAMGEHYKNLDEFYQAQLAQQSKEWNEKLNLSYQQLDLALKELDELKRSNLAREEEDRRSAQAQEAIQSARLELDKVIHSAEVTLKLQDQADYQKWLSIAQSQIDTNKELQEKYLMLQKVTGYTGTAANILKLVLTGVGMAYNPALGVLLGTTPMHYQSTNMGFKPY